MYVIWNQTLIKEKQNNILYIACVVGGLGPVDRNY